MTPPEEAQMSKKEWKLVISPALLEKSEAEFYGEFPAELLELTPDTSGYAPVTDVSYRLTAAMITGNITVTGTLSCRISGECGRCLTPVEREVKVDDLCLFYDDYPEDGFDISEDLRAEMLLVMPMNLLCGDDCRGLCPVCGGNLNERDCHCRPADDFASSPAEESSPWGALDELKLK